MPGPKDATPATCAHHSSYASALPFGDTQDFSDARRGFIASLPEVEIKNADGRMQLWVIGAMPLVFIIGFGVMWPGYFDPLTTNLTGYFVIAFIVLVRRHPEHLELVLVPATDNVDAEASLADVIRRGHLFGSGDGMVYTSHRYMASGLSVLAPRVKATVGAV